MCLTFAPRFDTFNGVWQMTFSSRPAQGWRVGRLSKCVLMAVNAKFAVRMFIWRRLHQHQEHADSAIQIVTAIGGQARLGDCSGKSTGVTEATAAKSASDGILS